MELCELREEARKKAFNKYSFTEYKQWTADKAAELTQQILRMNTKKYDQEELIRTALMVEDAISMLWTLMSKDSKWVEDIKRDIYTSFETMEKEIKCAVVADTRLNIHEYKN